MEGFVLQKRDHDLLLGLFESRIMTAAHIAKLFFDGKKEATKKRLQKIKAAGFISERKRRVNEPSVLFLTRKGFALLSNENLLEDYPKLSATTFEKRANVSALTIRHELEVMDVKAAFYSALQRSKQFEITEFSTWPRLHEFKASRPGHSGAEVLVKPDGFIRIHEKEVNGEVSEHTFFLEVDRSTESQATLVARASCYLNYYKSGGFAVRVGARREDYKDFPFRVMIILKSVERRNNTAEQLLQTNPPILTQVHLSTFQEVTKDPLDKIWCRPIDYREVIKTSVFAKPHHMTGYRREQAREKYVEETLRKVSLLEASV